MTEKFGKKTAWFILLLIAAAVVAMVFTPVYFIKPFSAQTETQVADFIFVKELVAGFDDCFCVGGNRFSGFYLEKFKALVR